MTVHGPLTNPRRLLLEGRAEEADPPTLGPLWTDLWSSWRDWAEGREPSVDLTQLEQMSRSAGRAKPTIEATVLRTLFALEENACEEALGHARRASRMARTESIPSSECIAALALARARRWNGQTFASATILASVRPFTSSDLLKWHEHEAAMSQGVRPSLGPRAPTPFLRDAAASDGANDAHYSDPFVRGVVNEPTRGTRTYWGVEGALVLASPQRETRRVSRAQKDQLKEVPDISTRSPGRAEEMIAYLATVGQQPLKDVFQSVYGFNYIPIRHDGTLRVLLHRIRKMLEGVAVVERSPDQVRLLVNKTFLVADPRTIVHQDARFLAVLAGTEPLSTSEIARRMGGSRRTVQDALRRLVESGICKSTGAGRATRYIMEDTTYRDPTKV